VKLIDARSIDSDRLRAIRSAYDLDRGMIFAHRGHFYWGADAIQVLGLLSSRVGIFSQVSAALFRYHWLSRAVYPVLRLGRIVALKLRGKGKIHAI
jgi:hypothetical protein